jgi:hypothetical protein
MVLGVLDRVSVSVPTERARARGRGSPVCAAVSVMSPRESRRLPAAAQDRPGHGLCGGSGCERVGVCVGVGLSMLGVPHVFAVTSRVASVSLSMCGVVIEWCVCLS